MTRPEAIEAAARAERDYAVDLCGPDVALPRWNEMTDRMRDNYRADAGRYYGSLAPHIESALLDRIEEAVKEKRDVAQRLREAAGKGSLVDWTEATRMDTLDAVLAILTEIREETGE